MFGTKNGGQVIFAVENPDPNDLGTMGVRRWFHLEKGLGLAGTKPGRYAISSIFYDRVVKSFDLGGWTNPQPLGVFSVKPGEVIYIGDLVFARSNMTLTMRVEDKFDEFKSTLPPALAMKLQKRLIKLPASVTFDTVTYTRIPN